MTNKVFKFCNKITKDPSFDAVVVFTITFLLASVLIPMTSALDGGEYCNHFNKEAKRSLCTKFNGVILVLAIAVPVILGLLAYHFAKNKAKRKARLYNLG